jgi:2-iminobutanoate/2-iminopropanoate deaminase
MTKQVISTASAPAAIGPYSQAIRVGSLVFVSGQIPLDERGQLVTGGIEDETRQVMQNLSAILAAGGTSLGHVVKTTVYLTDMNDFAAVNGVYGSFFPSDPPARATVAVAALPKGARIEIDVVAHAASERA